MNKLETKSVIAGLYGNALEWYDFLLYASFAPLFVNVFFPADNDFISLITTFSVFAIGFLMRPIGGAVVGHYADHSGRRKALIFSITIMTIATLCIALLPSFHSIGLVAPICFTFLRLIQGFAVGGELPSSATFLVEHMFQRRRGLAGSLVLSSAFFGIFAGACVASILSETFSTEQMLSWGWRIAYLIGGVLGLFGIYLRLKSVEPAPFLETEITKELPAKIVFTNYGKQLFIAIMFTSVIALSNYILIAYVTTYLVKAQNFLLRDALFINLIALFVLTIGIPIMGFLSDYVGRQIIFNMGLICLLVFSFPFFWLIQASQWYTALWSEVIFALILAPLNATLPTIITEIFPTEIRASGAAISYNIGQAAFGGTLPLIALSLIEFTGNPLAPAYYVFSWALVVLLISSTKWFSQEKSAG